VLLQVAFGKRSSDAAFENPFENTTVFAVARPDETAIFVAAEPVGEGDLKSLFCD
jgi:hypothetical protein